MSSASASCVKVVPDRPSPMRLDRRPTVWTGAGRPSQPLDRMRSRRPSSFETGGRWRAVIVSWTRAGSESLRAALAMGADRAVAVTDPAIAGSDLLGTSRVLAAAIARSAPTCHLRIAFRRWGWRPASGPPSRERLSLPVVSGARTIEVDAGRLRAARQVAGGDQVV